MTDGEIEEYRRELNELTAECSDSSPESRIREKLKKLAWRVGASTCVLYPDHTTGDADTSEITRNIHQALQTASMANMCGKAAKAMKSAPRQFWIMAIIAFFSTVAACVSAVAAWVAAMRV